MSKDIKQFLQEELEKEEIATMKEVAEDKEVQGLTAPEEMDEALFAQIAAFEADLAKAEKADAPRFTAEEEELMRLGMVYKRRRRYTKYIVLAAVLIMVLAVGTTSLGGPEKVLKTIVEKFSKDRTRVETLNDDGSLVETKVSEDEAYQQVKDKWNVELVRLQYLPEGVGFGTFAMLEDIQTAQLEYYKDNEVKLIYQILPGYTVGSFASDVTDRVIKEYEKEVKEVSVTIRGYEIENNTERWVASFVYQDIQYFLWVYDANQGEMEKIVENLYFL